jgi:lactate racemase
VEVHEVKLEMLYGDRSFSLELPEEKVAALIEAKPLPAGKGEAELIAEALANPVESHRLADLVSKGETACIVIGDMTRLWVKHDRFLPALLNELNRGGIADQDIVLVSATGDHREQTDEEYRLLAGDEAFERVKIYDHISAAADLVYLGETSNGTPVKINRRVVEAERVIITGGIVYHFLAGWGGGKKAIIPGVAARDTIMANHALAFMPGEGEGLNPAVCAGRMHANPCSDDMLEGTQMVAPDFLLNTVIDENSGLIAGVFAGHFVKAHEAGCRFVDSYFRAPLEAKADVVIASCGGYPKDINFYQTYKTIYNAHQALRPGGTMLLISESREGIGSDQFLEIFTDYDDNKSRELALRSKYSIGGQMAYHAALIAEENDLLVLSGLPADLVKKMGMIPVDSLATGLDFINKKHGEKVRYCLMPHGGSTLPDLV